MNCNKLIVSCQAEGNSPFNKPQYIELFVRCAEMSNIPFIRLQGIENIRYISQSTSIPIIGLVKQTYDDGLVKISRNESDIKQILNYTNIVAIDGTFRSDNGLNGPQFIKYIAEHCECKIVADISSVEEAIECAKYTNYISTALSGYTTSKTPKTPNYKLLREIRNALPNCTLIAEGRFNTPKQAAKAIKCRADYVCVGSAITRPLTIISWYNEEINNIK